MRLIDADALKEEIEFHPTSVSVCMTVAEAKGQTYFKNRCLEDIANAPTVDAIPVDWIHKYADTVGSRVRAEIVREMLDVWEKEKEVR